MLVACHAAHHDDRSTIHAPRFAGITRMIAARLTRRTGLGLLAGASLPLLGLAAATDAKKYKKITLCFNGKTVKKPKKQAKKLLKQGACGAISSRATPRVSQHTIAV